MKKRKTASANMGTAYALLIGIAQYRHLSPLSKTVTDVHDLHDLFAQSGCYPTSNLVLLVDGQATRGGIDDKLDWLARHASSKDTVIIFFSGHGVQRIGGFTSGEYLCPVEADLNNLQTTAISDEEFTRALHHIHAAKVAVFLDACHSGGVGGPKDAALQIKPGLSEAAYSRLAEDRGRVIIASCRPDEVSWIFSNMRNSLFTHYLLEGLRGAAADTERVVCILDLYKYVFRQVSQRQSQHPSFWGQAEPDFAIIGDKLPVATPTPVPASPDTGTATVSQQTTAASIVPYVRRLREAMCLALNRADLKLLCADLGLGAEFVVDEKKELECQRVIDECKRRGRRTMENLLSWLRHRRSEQAFPSLPLEDDPWWIE